MQLQSVTNGHNMYVHDLAENSGTCSGLRCFSIAVKTIQTLEQYKFLQSLVYSKLYINTDFKTLDGLYQNTDFISSSVTMF
jgi:hypothetical protein